MIEKPDTYPGWIKVDGVSRVWVNSEEAADLTILAMTTPRPPDPPGYYHGIPIRVCDTDTPA